MKYRVFIDGAEGTTGLKIHQYFQKRDDIEVLGIEQEKRKDMEERLSMIKKADVSFRPKDGLIAASADATIGKTAETDSSVPRRYLHFLLPQPVALIDDHRIRLQVHMLYGLRKRSIHYRCQYFYLHACSPPCSVFCVCMAPGRK